MPESHNSAELSALHAELLGFKPGATAGTLEPELAIGRIVHYKLESGPNKGELRPAIVVRVWNPTCCQLQVFTDNTNDDLPCPYWATSRVQGDAPGQWQWPQLATPIPIMAEAIGG